MGNVRGQVRVTALTVLLIHTVIATSSWSASYGLQLAPQSWGWIVRVVRKLVVAMVLVVSVYRGTRGGGARRRCVKGSQGSSQSHLPLGGDPIFTRPSLRHDGDAPCRTIALRTFRVPASNDPNPRLGVRSHRAMSGPFLLSFPQILIRPIRRPRVPFSCTPEI